VPLLRALERADELVLDEIFEVRRDVEQLDDHSPRRSACVDAHDGTAHAEPATAAVEPEIDPDESSGLRRRRRTLDEEIESADRDIQDSAVESGGSMHDRRTVRLDTAAVAALGLFVSRIAIGESQPIRRLGRKPGR